MIAPALALAALVWLALLILTPLVPSSLGALMYSIGAFVCHQIPVRSFHLGESQLPVCGRCLGVYAGAALTAWVCAAAQHRVAIPLTSLDARAVFVLGALPSILTHGLEWSGVWHGANVVRAVAGAALGIGGALVVMSAVATLHYSGCLRRRPIEPSQIPPHI